MLLLLALATSCGEERRGRKPELEALIAHAGSDDPVERRRAIRQLGQWYGERASPAIPVLTRALQDENPKTVALAAAALRKIGPRARSAVPALVEAMQSTNNRPASTSCAMALGAIAFDAARCVPALRDALRAGAIDPPAGLRALGAFGQRAGAAIPDMLRFVGGDHSEDALVAISNVGPAAEAAVPTLVGFYRAPGSSEKLRDVAMWSLQAIGRASVPPLVEMIRESGDLRAIDVVAALGPDARAAVPALAGVLERPEAVSGRSWSEAARALKRIGYDATWEPRVVAALERAAKRGVRRAKQALALVPKR